MHDRRAPGATLEFRPDIEGLRGIAVLLVVAFHAGVPGIGGGFVGVDVFFVISGYLIFGLLLEELQQHRRIDFWRFYARRARRLLPAAALTIAATLAVAAAVLLPTELRPVASAALFAAASASNLWFAWSAVDYFGADIHDNPLLHTWSLAVEEQFYLLFPVLLLLLFRWWPRRRALAVAVAAISVVSFASCVVVTAQAQAWAFYGTPLRAWEFGLGALAYLARPQHGAASPRGGPLLAWAGCLAIGAGAAFIDARDGFPGWLALAPVAGTALALYGLAGQPTRGPGRILAMAPMQWLGRLSYSWYLWHWPFLTLGPHILPGQVGLAERLGLAAASLAVAAIAFEAIENPIRRHRLLLSRHVASVGLGVAMIAAGCGAALTARAWSVRQLAPDVERLLDAAKLAPDLRDCIAGIPDTAVVSCSFGPERPVATVVLYGDSHALSWLPALRDVAQSLDIRVVTLLKSSCPAADGTVYSKTYGRSYDECAAWRAAALRQLVDLRPDLAVLNSSWIYMLEEEIKGTRPLNTIAGWQSGYRATLRFLADHGIPALLIRDNPFPGFDVARCVARAAQHDEPLATACPVDRQAAVVDAVRDAELAALSAFPASSYLDVTAQFCGAAICPAYIDGLLVYRDHSHMTMAFAHRLAPLLRTRIAAALHLAPRL